MISKPLLPYNKSFWLSLPLEQRQKIVNSLTTAEAIEWIKSWPFWARAEQLPPPGSWFCWLILAGRGWGKTRTGAEWIRARAESGKFRSFALIGQTAADVRDVLVEGPESGILAVSHPRFMPRYEPSKRRLTWPNGAQATTFSGDEPDQLRGPQHDSVWVDELAKWKYPVDAWDNMEFGLRLGDQPQVVVTTTPRPIPIILSLNKDPDVVQPAHRLSTKENIDNIAPQFLRRVLSKYQGTRLGRQELDAEILDDNPYALWSRALIEATRISKVPDLVRVAGGIDPTATTLGDEAGIIFGGLAPCACKGYIEMHGFIIDDRSCHGSPATWAKAAVSGYHIYKADRLVAEINNGGEMVELTIRSVEESESVAYTSVHASRGKYTRAEPIASLYEQHKVHHVGMFAELEDELCQWTPGEGESPNRLDALVWLLTHLFFDKSGDLRAWSADDLRSFSRNGSK